VERIVLHPSKVNNLDNIKCSLYTHTIYKLPRSKGRGGSVGDVVAQLGSWWLSGGRGGSVV
jgi:hypothetical protein